MKIASLVVLWLLLVAGGMISLETYKSTPGAQAAAPSAWPVESKLARVTGSKTLVMMSHPKCPCTRASLAELESLLAQYQEQITVYILFVRPGGVAYDWTKTDLWRAASRTKGVNVVIDDNSTEADRFHGLTSGQVVLYDADGRLQFNGGITGARGHIGDNLGLSRILGILRGQKPDRSDSPVFGCPLHAEAESKGE
jgi:hypothetical protein